MHAGFFSRLGRTMLGEFHSVGFTCVHEGDFRFILHSSDFNLTCEHGTNLFKDFRLVRIDLALTLHSTLFSRRLVRLGKRANQLFLFRSGRALVLVAVVNVVIPCENVEGFLTSAMIALHLMLNFLFSELLQFYHLPFLLVCMHGVKQRACAPCLHTLGESEESLALHLSTSDSTCTNEGANNRSHTLIGEVSECRHCLLNLRNSECLTCRHVCENNVCEVCVLNLRLSRLGRTASVLRFNLRNTRINELHKVIATCFSSERTKSEIVVLNSNLSHNLSPFLFYNNNTKDFLSFQIFSFQRAIQAVSQWVAPFPSSLPHYYNTMKIGFMPKTLWKFYESFFEKNWLLTKNFFVLIDNSLKLSLDKQVKGTRIKNRVRCSGSPCMHTTYMQIAKKNHMHASPQKSRRSSILRLGTPRHACMVNACKEKSLYAGFFP